MPVRWENLEVNRAGEVQRVLNHFGFVVAHADMPMRIGEIVEGMSQPFAIVDKSNLEEYRQQLAFEGREIDSDHTVGPYFYRCTTD